MMTIRIRYFIFAIIIFGFSVTLTRCEEESTVQSISYFPLAVGNSWTYAPSDTFYSQPFQFQLTERNGDTVKLVRPPGQSHSGTVTLLDHCDEIDLLLGNQGFVPFYRFTVNNSWLRCDTWECDDSSRWIVVTEPNPIITPAGIFSNCIRIERQSTTPCPDAGTMFEWWAPGVGLVKWDELNYYAGGPLSFYLIDYTIH